MTLFGEFIYLYNSLGEFRSNLNDTPASKYTNGFLQTMADECNTIWTKFKTAYDACKRGPDSQIEEKHRKLAMEKYKVASDMYYTMFGFLRDEIEKLKVIERSRADPVTSSADSNFVKLPPIEIEPFNGDYKSWPSFRDMFTSVYIEHPKLSNVQKLYHLRTKCKNEAFVIVDKFPLTTDSFVHAWQALKNQYENKRMLINSQLRSLFTLPSIGSESASAIRKLHHTVTECLTALKNHEVDIQNWDPILIYLISSKLPNTTLALWEQSIKNPIEIPNWIELDTFLHSRFRALESIADVRSQTPIKPLEKTNSTFVYNNKKFNSFATQNYAPACKLCSLNHPLRQCGRFLEMNVTSRHEFVKNNSYCFNCLALSHSIKNCRSKINCSHCDQRHHSLLHKHEPEIQSTNEPTTCTEDGTLPDPSQVQSFFTTQDKNIVLATALVKVQIGHTNHLLRALIDPGSQVSFALQSSITRLAIPTQAISAQITGMGTTPTAYSNKKCVFSLGSRFDSTFACQVEAIVLKKLTGVLPSKRVDLSQLPNLDALTLADPEFDKPGRVELVLGADIYPSIIREGIKIGNANQPLAQNTVFGWVLSGPCGTTSANNSHQVSSFHCEVSLNEAIQRFWEIEEVVQAKPLSEEDKYCEQLFTQTTTRNCNGRYVVHLPFKVDFPSNIHLGHSRKTALAQFLRHERSLEKHPDRKTLYNNVLLDYLKLGHMIPSNNIETENNSKFFSFYLPHHGVVKPQSTSTKLRVVFNASCPTSNHQSLNDVLHIGPALQNDLSMLIHRWRKYPFVFSADIEKMYRQIKVCPQHTEFQRIIFRETQSQSVQDYKLQTVTFGVNCAPYLAIRSLLQLAEDEGSRFPVGAEIVKNDFYVDDVLSGAYDLESAKIAQHQVTELLKLGGFPLKKWAANAQGILQKVPIEHRLFEDLLALDETSMIKALGVSWNVKDDTFTFKIKPFDIALPSTKRTVFSNIAKLFDPAGWLAPILIFAKILIQEVWTDKTDWDDPLLPHREQMWHQFQLELPTVERIRLPRWIHYHPQYHLEYHGFCDASQKAIAAAMYVRIVDGEGNYHVHLLSAKTKVAPLKVISLPRLELCGAVLLAKLVKSMSIGLKCEQFDLYLWTDSTIVLAWLNRSPHAWKTFVANRVSQILDNVGPTQWRHVASEENPADLATRGVLPAALINNQLWWHGPPWLHKDRTFWPCQDIVCPEGMDMEEKPIQAFATQYQTLDEFLNRFSTLERTLRVLCFIFRFLHRTHPHHRQTFYKKSLVLHNSEIKYSKERLIIFTQKKYFHEELTLLIANKPISPGSALTTMNPFIDSQGLLRASGRLSHSTLPYKEKFPLLLPYSCRLSHLLVEYIHRISLHGGPQLMLNLIRKEYWIPKLKNLIKSKIFNCKRCFLLRKETQQQLMGSLPPERVIFSRPFCHVGVDYTGAFDLRVHSGRFFKSVKGYVSVFVCFSTRAIHLEVVGDLSTQAFLGAFSRFVSRRGVPSCIYSDNGTNFVGANTALNKEIRRTIQHSSDVAADLYAIQGLNWKFIPPGAPHMGGLWEAGVKSLKQHLRRILGPSKLTFEEFSTVIIKIEACLNSRPISPISERPEDCTPLTPGHFLIGDALLAVPEDNVENLPGNTLSRWQKIQLYLQQFSRRWKEEYLHELQRRNKWKFPQRNLEPNDLVVVKNENLPPTLWRLGRIINVHPGKDKRVRVATLKTQSGIITRPIVKLCLLPIDDTVNQNYNAGIASN